MLTPGRRPGAQDLDRPARPGARRDVQSPETDRYGYTADYLRGRIVGALGGRAAEELVFGQYTTGAENDLESVTAIARQMVGRWGMSDAIGPMSVLPPAGDEGSAHVALGLLAGETRERFDAEIRRIIDEGYQRAFEILREHRDPPRRARRGAAGARDARRGRCLPHRRGRPVDPRARRARAGLTLLA